MSKIGTFRPGNLLLNRFNSKCQDVNLVSYDSKGNCIPTILLMMQDRQYSQGDLKAEGVFRLNPENSQEKHARDQLNRGIVPDDTSVHYSAMQHEEEPVEPVKQLKPPEAALLNWAVGLMADIVEEEDSNKKTAGNIAMDYAPNMTRARECPVVMEC
ncbi:hypothetical protein Peur_011699 [Populus x canadensis]